MELNEVQKDKRENKTTNITVRTTRSLSKWMRDNNVSPTLVFNKAILELKNTNK